MSLLMVEVAWVNVGRSGCLCKRERGWGFVEGGGSEPLMMRAGCDVMSRCTIVVDWLVSSFVAQAGVRHMVWAIEVRGAIGVKKLGWCSIGIAGVRRRVRV